MITLPYAILPVQRIIQDTAYIWRFQTQDEAEQAARDLILKHNVQIEVFRLVSTVTPTIEICREP